jgi:choline dehydrogenase
MAASRNLQFDYVIVGAGSAGCVLAEALSRNGRSTVAIIEAGGTDRKFFVQMPLGYGKTFYDRSINWNYRAEPDPGLNGQTDYWPRGKILGGSGSINAMVWIRGDARDYDDWAAEGNPGWSYDEVLPFFKAIEDNGDGPDQWRGAGGPMRITSQDKSCHPLTNRFVRAALSAGFVYNHDFNARSQEGVGVYQVNIADGQRMSAARAFLRPALKRPNVRLFTHALATRILLDGSRAAGVEIEQRGERLTLLAGKETVLAAGAINSPQLLQLSGIGPAAHLASLGITPAADLPAVGNHLQDHLGINYIFRATAPTLNQRLRPWWGKAIAGLQYLLARRGPLSQSMNQGGGFVKSRAQLDRPNIQLYFQAFSIFGAKTGTKPLLEPDAFPGFAIGMSNCRPTARGSIMIGSADPHASPVIRPNAFGTDHDVADMLDGVKVIRRIAAEKYLSEIIAEELLPGPSVCTDEALVADFRNRSGTVYHPCGTVRMGRDPSCSAVDHRLRIHGISGLRVADASIFPSIISGNTNAPVMMVAAKAAAMIMEDEKHQLSRIGKL